MCIDRAPLMLPSLILQHQDLDTKIFTKLRLRLSKSSTNLRFRQTHRPTTIIIVFFMIDDSSSWTFSLTRRNWKISYRKLRHTVSALIQIWGIKALTVCLNKKCEFFNTVTAVNIPKISSGTIFKRTIKTTDS